MRRIWLDLETTDIDPTLPHSRILEIGIVITTHALHEMAAGSYVIRLPADFDTAPLHPNVVDMHLKNGLFAECLGPDAIELPDAIDRLTRLIELSTGPDERTPSELAREVGYAPGDWAPMCGNTIGFDRGWLKVHAPEFEKRFHYRNADASAVAEVMRMFGLQKPEWKELTPDLTKHRALDDCLASIALAKYMAHGGEGWDAIGFHARCIERIMAKCKADGVAPPAAAGDDAIGNLRAACLSVGGRLGAASAMGGTL